MRIKLGKYRLSIRRDIRRIELRNTQWRSGVDSWHVKQWRF